MVKKQWFSIYTTKSKKKKTKNTNRDSREVKYQKENKAKHADIIKNNEVKKLQWAISAYYWEESPFDW